MYKKSRLFIFAIFFFALFFAATFAQDNIPATTIPTGIDPETKKVIADYIRDTMQRKHIPGIAVGVVKGDKVIYTGYFGWANIEQKKPVGEDTIFRIASISKTITTVGLMQQWEQKKFDLDDDVNKYFPEPMIIPPHPKEHPVTFRHLLTHTSGGGEFLSFRQAFAKGFGALVEGEDYKPLAYYLRFKMRTKLDPGTTWAYSNYGFGFVGYALECISGAPFHEYQKKNVFDRLGMVDATYHHNAAVLKRLAQGYMYKDGAFVPDPHKAMGITPAGSVYMTLKDMSLYVIALLNGGANQYGRVLKPETLELMFKTHYTLDDRQSGQGLAFFIHGNNMWGYRGMGHGGAMPFGFTSGMFFVHSEKLGVYLFCNLGADVAENTAWGVLKRVLKVNDKTPAIYPPDKSVYPQILGYYGPEFHDFKTNMRLYMKNIGAYKIIEINGELAIESTWQGEEKALKIHRVSADDPFFFWVETKGSARDELPSYVSFKKRSDGKFVMIPGGLNEYVKLEGFRKASAVTMTPLGRFIGKINPLAEF